MTVIWFCADKFLKPRLEPPQPQDVPLKHSKLSTNPASLGTGLSEALLLPITEVMNGEWLHGGSTASICQSSLPACLTAQRAAHRETEQINLWSSHPSPPAKPRAWRASGTVQECFCDASALRVQPNSPCSCVSVWSISVTSGCCQACSHVENLHQQVSSVLHLSQGARDLVLAGQRGFVVREGHNTLTPGDWHCSSEFCYT